MPVRVILDTDFLSAFIKIGRLTLVRELYAVDVLTITPAVYYEVAQTSLLSSLLALDWLEIERPSAQQLITVRQLVTSARLGTGELESIALALGMQEYVLLSNDNRARQEAQRHNLTVTNIPAFLLACKWAGLVDQREMRRIIEDLWSLDHYKFRQEIIDLLTT